MSFEQLDIPDRTDDWVEVLWMPNGLPLFLADREDICDVVESMGFSIYYLFGNNVTTTTTTTKGAASTVVSKTFTTSNAQMFKVVNNFIGRSISKCDEELPSDFKSFQEEAVYTMPPIPWKLVEKLDEFFRLVDAQHGTESIVLLTYDTTIEGSDGWGVLVPDQTNTNVHCNYDPTSVIEHKPENALIVGSVHSHPNMAAYASGTDHNDQADFDGIHITFGWQKSVNNNATQYHIEMQMSGSSYTLKPDDVFENIVVDRDPDPEVVGWTEHVKKALPPHHHMAAGATQASLALPAPKTTAQGATLPPPTTPPGTRDHSKVQRNAVFEQFPDVWKTLGKDSIVIAEVVPNNLGTYDCPSCGYDLLLEDVQDGYCNWCTVPVVLKSVLEENRLDDILTDLGYWCYLFNYSTNAKVYLWITNGGTENTIMPLTQVTLSEAITKPSFAPHSNNDPYREDEFYLDAALLKDDFIPTEVFLCCGVSTDFSEQCQCEVSIHPMDVLDFDQHVGKVQLYDVESICTNCNYYYDPRCPGYRLVLSQYVYDRTIDPKEFSESIDGFDCTAYVPFSVQGTYSSFNNP